MTGTGTSTGEKPETTCDAEHGGRGERIEAYTLHAFIEADFRREEAHASQSHKFPHEIKSKMLTTVNSAARQGGSQVLMHGTSAVGYLCTPTCIILEP